MARIRIRRYLWIVAVVVLCAYVFARLSLGDLMSFEGPISQANCDRIKTGMSPKDVEGILGEPSKRVDNLWVWGSENGVIMVTFDEKGATVVEKEFLPLYRQRWHARRYIW